MGDESSDLDLRLFSDSEFSDKEDDGSNTDEDSEKELNTNITRLCAALLVRRLKRRKQRKICCGLELVASHARHL